MQYTEHLNMNKPGSSDQYNIEHFNQNFDTIDSHIHTLEESAADVELEIVEKIAEAEQFPNMQGVCPVNKGGTGANNAQAALNNLHSAIQLVNEMPDTAEVHFINHIPADPQEGTPEIKNMQGVNIDVLAEKVFEKIRTDPGIFSQTKNGFVPKTGSLTGLKFLSSNGLWQAPEGTQNVYEATTSRSWDITGDTILRIEDDCTSVIADASYGTKLTIVNETEDSQNVSLNLESGYDLIAVPAGEMVQYIWTGFWRVWTSGGGGSGVSNNAPIGTVVGYLGTVAPENWLILQGQTLSRADYSGLFKWANDNELVGTGKPFGAGDGTTTFVLPDYRECALVGVGENGTDTIADHDVYGLGEFKDDQLQDHTHINTDTSAISVNAGSQHQTVWAGGGGTGIKAGRHGLVSRGKRKGVNFIIKAKNDVNKIIVPTVVNTIEKWADSRWLTYSFTAENRQTLRVKGGTRIDLKIADGGSIETRTFEVEEPTDYDLSDLITGAANYASERNGEKNGRVFSVFLAPYGEDDVKLVVSTRFDAPSDIDQSYSVNNTRWIGCFSTLCVAVPANTTAIVPVARGTANGSSYLIKQSYALDTDGFNEFYTKTISAVTTGTYYDVATVPHTLAGFAAGDILPESVWCLGFMPSARSLNMNNILGMVYDGDTDKAIDIYLQSGMGQNTATVYNATHTVSRHHQNCDDDMRQVGKLLISADEFSSAALGSNERTSIYGSADKTTVGGHVDTAERRMISFVGCEEMCGYLWQWQRDVSAIGGSGFSTYDGGAFFGQTYGNVYALIAGGTWTSGVSCGSRCQGANVCYNGGVNTGGRGVSRVMRG